jgi:hypothetical protein
VNGQHITGTHVDTAVQALIDHWRDPRDLMMGGKDLRELGLDRRLVDADLTNIPDTEVEAAEYVVRCLCSFLIDVVAIRPIFAILCVARCRGEPGSRMVRRPHPASAG